MHVKKRLFNKKIGFEIKDIRLLCPFSFVVLNLFFQKIQKQENSLCFH
jgi:hypothetical protein